MVTQSLEIIKKWTFLKKILCCFGLFQLANVSATSEEDLPCKNNIRIYGGEGTDEQCRHHTYRMCQTYFPESVVSFIDPSEVKAGTWKSSTWLFIVPGGRDTPYAKHLSPEGEDQIVSFVNKGGCFLGLCAGAYYASRFVRFAEDTPCIRVVTTRRLCFYPGISSGPAYEPFSYNTEIDALPASVEWGPSQSSTIYYNGGGFFKNGEGYTMEDDPFLSVLGRYADQRVAVIRRRFGKGRVFLSHVHFEIDPYHPEFIDYFHRHRGLSDVLQQLQDGDNTRKAFVTYFLKEMGAERFVLPSVLEAVSL